MTEMRRIAVLDHASAGGVSRFLLALLTHMARQHPDDLSIDYFVASGNIERDDLTVAFASLRNVRVVPIRGVLESTSSPGGRVEPPRRAHGVLWRSAAGLVQRTRWLFETVRPVYRFLRRLPPIPKPWYHYGLDADVAEGLRTCDLVYIGWPYFLEPVDLRVPVVATFHDFHYRVFPEAYPPDQLEIVERQTPQWLKRCSLAITSSRYIRDQLLGFYADVAPAVDVINLSPYGFEVPSPDVIETTLRRLGVRRPYVLYTGARGAHKNVASLVRAIGILKQRGTPIQFVITGHGTEVIGDSDGMPDADPVHLIEAAISEHGLVRGEDYLALGYVSNQDVDALTAGTDAIVSASLYEAGCGPAMDAWQASVPVAFSDIPPFVEQLERRGVHAWVFDPHDPADIADKILDAVSAKERMARESGLSLRPFSDYTWDDVARGYYRAFVKAFETGARS